MLEGFGGNAEQCNIRARRYGGLNIPYGDAAPSEKRQIKKKEHA